MLEGPDLVAAALDAGATLEAVYFDARAETEQRAACNDALARASAAGVRLIELAEGVIDRVTDAVTPQPLVGVAAMPPTDLGVVPRSGFCLVLCEIRDPGNLGTAVRAADAAGVAAVVVAGQCADLFNPKTLRATAGSAFHLPIAVEPSTRAAIDALHASGRRCHGAVVHGGEPLWTAPLEPMSAVVVGSEAKGLGEAELALLDGTLSIPMAGRAESLNAGVAAALVCFEALRRSALPAPRPTI